MNPTTFPVKPQTERSTNGLLERPLQFTTGVGPARAALLSKLGLSTVGDLLRHYPRTHEDRRLDRPGGDVPGTPLGFVGTVLDFHVGSGGKDLLIGRGTLSRNGTTMEALWFRRRSYRYDAFATLKKKLTPGTRLFVYGPWRQGPRGPEVRVEDHEFPTEGPSPHMDRWTPVYDLTEGLDGRWLRGLVWALRDSVTQVPDPLPDSVRERHGLPTLAEALAGFHFPEDAASRDKARRRLSFDEYFTLELAMARVRESRHGGPPAPVCAPSRTLLSPFRQRMGFDFTNAQKRVINEIFSDMARPQPMNRLLMGEVGSGKTVVAVSAILLAVESGRQAALMAPTEILAEQHAQRLSSLLEGVPVRWALVTGGRTSTESRRQRENLASGEIHVAVGTHALLERKVVFKDLGLVVIDEQHRFGVDQRASLGAKGVSPHVLLMTATPIPRTLAMTYYGDLSVSAIDELPPGRPSIASRWTSESEALAAVERAVGGGRQAYVVFPLVEDSEKLDLKAVMKGWEQLKQRFPSVNVGLLHGRMKSSEKEAAMGTFVRGDTQILAATPVIEVGIDVANAAVLVIMNAERFGLAQLHQLRGRVGRGNHPSSCFLVTGAPSADAAERLKLFCHTRNGFVLAEEDLRRRGPGEFLGEAQHGLPELRLGHLAEDGPLIEEARAAANALVKDDPFLTHRDHGLLAGEVLRRYGDRLRFARVA